MTEESSIIGYASARRAEISTTWLATCRVSSRWIECEVSIRAPRTNISNRTCTNRGTSRAVLNACQAIERNAVPQETDTTSILLL
eukprot:XP_001708940.1 Hypothetical protein GL50803_92167 [Giardia lamblia ATCC 50803]